MSCLKLPILALAFKKRELQKACTSPASNANLGKSLLKQSYLKQTNKSSLFNYSKKRAKMVREFGLGSSVGLRVHFSALLKDVEY